MLKLLRDMFLSPEQRALLELKRVRKKINSLGGAENVISGFLSQTSSQKKLIALGLVLSDSSDLDPRLIRMACLAKLKSLLQTDVLKLAVRLNKDPDSVDLSTEKEQVFSFQSPLKRALLLIYIHSYGLLTQSDSSEILLDNEFQLLVFPSVQNALAQAMSDLLFDDVRFRNLSDTELEISQFDEFVRIFSSSSSPVLKYFVTRKMRRSSDAIKEFSKWLENYNALELMVKGVQL